MPRKPADLAGQEFGKLTAKTLTAERRCGSAVWVCACKCGKEKKISHRRLTLPVRGTKSCGCLRGDAKRNQARLDEMHQLRETGMNGAEIGRRMGVSRQRIWKVLKTWKQGSPVEVSPQPANQGLIKP